MAEHTRVAPGKVEQHARWAVTGYFVITGLALATWTSRIPTIRERLGLSDAEVTLALFALAAGSVIAMQGVGRLIDRFGSQRLLAPAGVLMSASVLVPGVAGSLPILVLGLALFGMGHGTLDVAMNSHALRVQHRYGRPILTTFHAVFSLGGLLGAGIGALAASSGISEPAHFLAVAVVLALISLLARSALLAEPMHEQENQDDAENAGSAGYTGSPTRHSENEPGAAGSDTTTRHISAPPRTKGVPAIIVLLGVLGFFCSLGEGAMADWSPLYLHDVLNATPGVAATGYAVFSAAMALFRFLGDSLVLRFGPVTLVRACGAIAGLGLGTALLAHNQVAAIIGFALFGTGLSCIVPQIFNAAGNRDQQRSGRNLAQVATFGYGGLLAGPVVIGVVTHWFGLTIGMAVPAVLALLIAATAGVVRIAR